MGVPAGVRPVFTSNLPMVAVARYVAMGLLSRQCVTVVSPLSCVDMRRPLEMPVSPLGALMRMSYVALSAGWSLEGNQVEAALGSQTTKTPSAVFIHP